MKYILLVDDQAIVRYGTIQLLMELYPGVQVKTAKDIDEMVDQLNKSKFELLILDIDFPGSSSFGMLDIIRLRQPDIKILVFSGYDEKLYAQRYLSAGAHGYLSKRDPEKKLGLAINTISQGNVYVSEELKQMLAGGKKETGGVMKNPMISLSDRELEVMNLLAGGLSLPEISERLNLQLSTVSTYRHRIFEKLDVSNVIDLVEKMKLYT